MTPAKKYRRCMVFAGGGFRFGIYLGMYAAARDAGRAPDLLLATCGGALAAAIVQGVPDDAQRKAWLASPEMYAFWRSLQAAPHAGIGRSLWRAAQRRLSREAAPYIPDLFQDYLFEVPQHLPLPAAGSDEDRHAPAVATIGGKLLFGAGEVGQPRGARKLFAQTVFCEPRAAALLQAMASPFTAAEWGAHAVADAVLTETQLPLADAARLSMVDFFYFPPVRHETGQGAAHYIGGVVDLFPIEVAHRLADEVMMEFKSPFDQSFAIPAWRAVLGLNGNRRLCQVHGQHADVWIDSSDISTALARQQVHKRLDWRHNRIGLRVPPDHATYARYIDDQWQYGYKRCQEALQRAAPGDNAAMRKVTRYNRAMPSPMVGSGERVAPCAS